MGRCPTCGVLHRQREVTQAERDEVDVYECSVCGDVLDESPPF
jgi:rubredoxin